MIENKPELKKHMKTPLLSSAKFLMIAFVLIASVVSQAVFPASQAAAGQITVRSLRLEAASALSDGGSKPGGTVNHVFTFTLPNASNDAIGSIKFEYCETAADVAPAVCVTPTGLVTTGATLGSQTGATGFTLNNASNGAPYLSRTAATTGGSVAVSYSLNSVVNPSYGATTPDTNKTFFVRISTYNSTNATGAPIDAGVVTASTAEPIILSGIMPESLVFCTGETIGLTGGVPDCTTATPGDIQFDSLFSPTATAMASSQMSASTNAGSGYVITVNGPTLVSGENSIAPLAAPTAPVVGVAQFGLNLRDNALPDIGYDVAPSPNGTNYRGQPATDYNTIDNYKFVTGEVVANSYNTVAGATDAQIYTVSYIVNVPGSQAAGTYTTTLTYICTPTF